LGDNRAEAIVDLIWKERRLALWESRELTRVVVGPVIHTLLTKYDFEGYPILLHEYATKRSLFGVPVVVKTGGVSNHLSFVVNPPWGPLRKPESYDPPAGVDVPKKTSGADGGISPSDPPL
jgi:hypothetical protein